MSQNKYHAAIAAFFFENVAIEEEITTLDFSLVGNFLGRYFGGFAKLKSEMDVNFVFTLPTYSHSVFIGLGHSNPEGILRILANIEDYEREKGVLVKFGESVLFPEVNGLISNLCYAILLFSTVISETLDRIPDTLEIERNMTRFFLAVPLNKSEFLYREEFGHDALLSKMQADGKEIFFT